MGGGKPFRNIQGVVRIIEGDEFVTDDDPKGDEKIDTFGNLLGGRRFKASTFTLPGRHPQRQYMLAIDAARTSGFRDSLYYFRRNLLAFKLNATQPEKDFLISEGKLGSHLRTRSVTLVTARSAFKLHGSKMIIDGRWVVDDYYEVKSLEEITAKGLKPGDLVGELPDPNAAHHSNELSALNAAANASSNKNDRGGGGGLGIYRAGGPTTIFGASGWGPYSDGPLNAVRKSLLSRDGVTEENWMWMMAMRVSEAGDEWAKLRKEALKVVEGVEGLAMGDVSVPSPPPAPAVNEEDEEDEEEDVEGEKKNAATVDPPPLKKRKLGLGKPVGIYEPHANIIHYRADTQPTRSRWQQLPDSATKREVLGGTKAGNGAWALAWVDTVVELPKPDDPPSPAALAREEALKAVELESVDEEVVMKIHNDMGLLLLGIATGHKPGIMRVPMNLGEKLMSQEHLGLGCVCAHIPPSCTSYSQGSGSEAATPHAQNLHALVIVQVSQKLRRDEEALRAFWPAYMTMCAKTAWTSNHLCQIFAQVGVRLDERVCKICD